MTMFSFRPIPGWMRASAIISIGGFLNGYDTGAIGAAITMPAFTKTFGDLSPEMRGFSVSLIMLMGAVPAFYAGRLADRYSHLRIVMVGALIFLFGAIMQAASSSLPVFLVGRGAAGLGEGFFLTNIAVYITEIAPAKRRGMLVSMPQFMVCLGICLGYFTCYGSIGLDSSLAWRLPFILLSFAAVLLFISCLFLPGSPRWLIARGRREDTLRACNRLNLAGAEIEEDILRPQTGSDQAPVGFLGIFRKPYRMRTMLAFFMLGMIQLSGIDGVLYYAPVLFAEAGLTSSEASFLASGVSAILALAISVPAFLFADAWNRRTCTIVGGVLLSGSMLAIGSLYASHNVHAHSGAGRWAVIVLIFIFALTYAATWGIVGKIYASEIQPVNTRAATNSVAQGLNFFTNWLVAFATPVYLARSSFGAYFLYGGLTLVTLIVLAIFMPETKGRSLEAIQDSFRSSSARAIPLGRLFLHRSHLMRGRATYATS